MKRSIKEGLIRIVILMIGLTIAHLGVTLFLVSNLGSDPFNVFVQGTCHSLSAAFHWQTLTHGRVHIVISLLIILALFAVDRSYVKIGTILCMVCGGPIIDGFTFLLGPMLDQVTALLLRILMLAIGCVILAFGMTIVIRSDAGTGPNDLVAVVISDKLHKRFSVIRIIVDATFIVIGFLLGGVAGIGTLICMLLVGPVAGIFLPINGRQIDKIIARTCGQVGQEKNRE